VACRLAAQELSLENYGERAGSRIQDPLIKVGCSLDIRIDVTF